MNAFRETATVFVSSLQILLMVSVCPKFCRHVTSFYLAACIGRWLFHLTSLNSAGPVKSLQFSPMHVTTFWQVHIQKWGILLSWLLKFYIKSVFFQLFRKLAIYAISCLNVARADILQCMNKLYCIPGPNFKVESTISSAKQLKLRLRKLGDTSHLSVVLELF